MVTTITMPQMGYDMQEGTVVKWRKNEGDEVSRGDVIAEIETDKAVVEMEAYESGILKKVVVPEGRAVPVGTLIAVIADPGEEIPDLATLEVQDPPPISAELASINPVSAPKSPPVETSSTIPIKASPIARRLAQERGIDLAKISGTGTGGRITESDIENYSKSDDSPDQAATETPSSSDNHIPLSRMRQAIASRTSQSKREAPHFYITNTINMGKAMDKRRELNETLPEESRISVNDLVVKACAQAIVKFPKFNSTFKGDHLELISDINIGIAIALEDGLIIASLPDCGNKTLTDIASAAKDLIERAHGGTLKSEEYTGSTFTISNMGMYDVDVFSAIIFPPQAAVLAIGSIKETPEVADGTITSAKIMKATVSIDHRVIDGADGAKFLQETKRLLENPNDLVN